MQRFLVACLVGLGSIGPALAEDAKPVAPEYVPIVVQKAEFDAVRKYLGGLSFDTAAPIMVFLNDAEAKAKAQWEADHEPKQSEPAKKP